MAEIVLSASPPRLVFQQSKESRQGQTSQDADDNNHNDNFQESKTASIIPFFI